MHKKSSSKYVSLLISYLLPTLRVAPSLSKPIRRSLLSLGSELLSWSLLGEGLIPRLFCWEVRSGFPILMLPDAGPDLHIKIFQEEHLYFTGTLTQITMQI